jgi:hypothetical protein
MLRTGQLPPQRRKILVVRRGAVAQGALFAGTSKKMIQTREAQARL